MDSDRPAEEQEHPAAATSLSDPIHPVQDQDDESRVNGIEEEQDLPPGYSADLPTSDPDSTSHSNSSIDEQHQPPSSSSNATTTTATSTSTNPSSSTCTQQPPRLFFDIAPLPDATSFQAGYLGLEPLGFKAWIKGEVMLKLDGNQNADGAQESVETLQRPRVNLLWNRCSITLTAVESVTRAGEARTVELFRSTSTLWEASTTSTSTSSTFTPPSTMPFSFQLTTDLPHCIHLPHSRLEYRLEARLHSSAGRSDQDESTSTICHLTRYTKPGSLSQLMDEDLLSSNSFRLTGESVETSGTESGSSAAASSSNLLPSTQSSHNSIPKEAFSLSPHTWSVSSPTPIHLQLGKTIYRRAEPMDLIVRIPPPETRALAEKGLRLRCVEAELVRIIEVRDGIGSSHQNGSRRKTSKAGKEPHWLNEKSDKGKQILPSGGEDADMEEIRRAIEKLDSVGTSRPTSTYSFSYDSTVPDYEHGEGPSNTSHGDELPPASIGQSSSSSSLSSSAIQTPTSSSSTLSSNQDPFLSHEALLSHSGKLCRFNSQRAILLRLTLHPPFAKANMPHPHPDHDTSSVAGPVYARAGGGGCESISQDTLMHKVSFKVKVRIGMTGERGESRDVRLEREVWILPGAAGVLEDSRQGEVSEEMNGQNEGTESTGDDLDPSRAEPNPSSDSSIEAPRISRSRRDEKRQAVHSEVEFSPNDGPFSSSSNGAVPSNGAEPPRGWQDGEEYDGFIDIGRALDAEEGDGSASGSDEWDGAYTYEDAQRDEVREFSRDLGGMNDSSTSSALGGIEHLSYSSFDSRLPLPTSSRSGLLPGIREFESSSQTQHRGYDYDARGPPPSMLESQNDWQVGVDLEVQVEGVGSAMPRRRGAEGFRLDSNLPNHSTVRSHEDFDDPPPSLWDTTDEDEATREIIRNHEDDQLNPPPPISPSGFEFEDQALNQGNGSAILSDEEGRHHHQQQSEDLPPPHSPPRPAYSLESQSSTHRDQQESGNPPPVNSSHVLEPPPYIDSSLQNRAPRSIQNPPNLSTSVDSEDRDQPPSNSILSPRSIMGISQIRSSRSDEARPPAYAHPPELNTNPQVVLGRNDQVVTAGGNSGGPPGYEA